MIYPPPKPPPEKSPFSDFISYLLRWIMSERVIAIAGYKKQETAQGVTFTPIPVIGAAGSSTGWNWRGLYAAGSYNTNDVVQFGAGTSAGIYLSTINSNANQPDSGIGWIQVSSSSGTWL